MPRRIVTVALAALALVAGGCSRDGDDGAGRQPPAPTTPPGAPASPAPAPPAIRFAVSGVDANGTRAPDEATVAAVMAGVDRWVAAAVVGPLHTGQPAGDLSGVFTPAALERLADPAVRAALVDEGMPAASTSITATTAAAALASVAGPDEVVALVAVQIDLKLTATGPSLNVDIGHNGELVLVPEGDSWKIESFLIHTTRDSKE